MGLHVVSLVVVAVVVGGAMGTTFGPEADALKKLWDSTWPETNSACCIAKRRNCPYDCKWRRYARWLTGDPCDNNWEGVACTPGCSSNCSIEGIILNDNNLDGTFPKGLLKNWPQLKRLHLRGNPISGTFPDELDSTPLLEELSLGSSFSGTLPSLPHPATYKSLYFQGRGLEGRFPPFSNLTALEKYHLYQTQVSGRIPDVTDLTRTERFVIYDNNNLNGPLPDFSRGPTGQFTMLKHLEIRYNNQLDGTVPDLTDLTQVKTFWLHDNALSGSLPALNPMTVLENFDVSDNRLTGTIPEFAANNQKTLQVVKANNNFLDEIKALVPTPTSLDALKVFEFVHNRVTGTFPCHITSYPSLEELRGNSNRLTGTLPCLQDLVTMSVYHLQDNDFVGTLPDATSAIAIKSFNIDYNRLSGTIPKNFVAGLGMAEEIGLGGNELSGTIPELNFMPNLHTLRLHRNHARAKLTPVKIMSPQGAVDDMATAFDGDPATTWMCAAQRCDILVDFGKEVCLESVRIMDAPKSKPVNLVTFEGCPTDVMVHQSSTNFVPDDVREPVVRHDNVCCTSSNPNAPRNEFWNWHSCTPGTWRTVGRKRHYDESDCWEGNRFDPYCRERTRFYKISFNQCSTTLCQIAELEFAEGLRLSGTVPSLAGLGVLDTLHIYGNQLTGTLPLLGPRWGNELLANDNGFSAQLDEFCPVFKDIKRVWIDHNRFTGTLPGMWCMASAVSIRFGHNQLTGTIPYCQCTSLEELYGDDNACCPAAFPTPSGHGSWKDEALQKLDRISPFTQCPRAGCGGGLEGPLPDFRTMPRLRRFGMDNNVLRGPLNDSLGVLTQLQWFRARHNTIAGTLPYKTMIKAANDSGSCNGVSWYLTNNTIWGPVPSLPQPIQTGCQLGSWHCGRRFDTRLWMDLELDHNRMWGPLPSRLERVQVDLRVHDNCWDCPLPTQATWAPPLNPTAPHWTLNDTYSSPDFNQSRDVNINCFEGVAGAERYELDGPSCPSEKPQSLYEHVDRCRPRLSPLNATFTEEEVRKGGALQLALRFLEDSVLPFWAPNLWRCELCYENASEASVDCSDRQCPYGPVDREGRSPCPVKNPRNATCPEDVAYVDWGFAKTCPVGPQASCPTNICQPGVGCAQGLCPAGQCPTDIPCDLFETCPFGPNGTMVNNSDAACELTKEVIHAPAGECVIAPNGTCPRGACNYPWGCNTSSLDVRDGMVWGPRPVIFTDPLKKLVRSGMVTNSTGQPWQATPRGFEAMRERLLPLSSFQLGPSPGADPYVDLPTELLITLARVADYDTAQYEDIAITVYDELLLAPFGVQRWPLHFQITPVPGVMSGEDRNTTEVDLRWKPRENHTVPLRVAMSMPPATEEMGWETFRCGENFTLGCLNYSVVQPVPQESRVCGWMCAVGAKADITVLACNESYLELEYILPQYSIPDDSIEVVQVEFTGECVASGLTPRNNTILVNITAVSDPPPTVTPTLPLKSRTTTQSATETDTGTPTETRSTTYTTTSTQPLLCGMLGSSTVCADGANYWWAPWLVLSLVFLTACCATWLFVYLKRPRDDLIVAESKPIVSKSEVAVEEEEVVTVKVREVVDDGLVTVTAKDVPSESLVVKVEDRGSDFVTLTVRSPDVGTHADGVLRSPSITSRGTSPDMHSTLSAASRMHSLEVRTDKVVPPKRRVEL